MSLFIRIAISALSLMAVSYIVPGITVENIYGALIAALVLGVLNGIVRPILIFLTLPVTILTLGVFILIINGFLFWLASTIVPGFAVEGVLSAVVGALLLTVISTVGNKILN